MPEMAREEADGMESVYLVKEFVPRALGGHRVFKQRVGL
jgi:hypothetical protein